MDRFDYCSLEVGNRPPADKITLERAASGSLKMSASEMLCFTRCFGEMVGDLVPEGDDVWQLYLLLREILEILFAPQFT